MLILALAAQVFSDFSDTVVKPHMSLYAYGFALLSVLFLYYLFFQLLRELEEKNSYKLMALSLEAQQKNLMESVEIYNQMRILRHELKNHVFYMRSLLKNGRMEELNDYFNKIYEKETASALVDSGSTVINSLLNQKKTYAASKSIAFSSQTALPETITIDEADLCTVLANLLDNAIEACESLSDPGIGLVIQQTGQYIHIQCKNTVDRDVLLNNPSLHTTKTSDWHGFGLRIIREITERYDGMLETSIEDGFFVVNLMLYSPCSADIS